MRYHPRLKNRSLPSKTTVRELFAAAIAFLLQAAEKPALLMSVAVRSKRLITC
jgi:hypothetical protein